MKTPTEALQQARSVADAARLLSHLYAFATRPAKLDIDRYPWPEYRRLRLDLNRDLIDFRRMFADVGGESLADIRAAIDESSLVWCLPDRPASGRNGWRVVEAGMAPTMFRAVACQLLGRLVYAREYDRVAGQWPAGWGDTPPAFRNCARENLRHRYGPRILDRWIP